MARSSGTRMVLGAAAVCIAALWLGCNTIIGLHEGQEFCTPMTEQTCYTGSAGTLDVGLCKAGVKQCNADGLGYGPCEGEVTPMPETCVSVSADPEDEDCNGLVDEEGAGCVCGDGVVSRTETCDDGNAVDGDGCDHNCTATACGNGIVSPGEQCDDGGMSDTDTCSSTCQVQEVMAVKAGSVHSCALLKGGSIKCWGSNGFGHLGLGDTSARGDELTEMGKNLLPVDLGTGATSVMVAAGNAHSCALLNGGSIKCWGYNYFGTLGLGDTSNRGDETNEMSDNLPHVVFGKRTAVDIAGGGPHTCARLDSGSVKCWGSNGDGQLGLGDANARGDNSGEMGVNLPPVDLGANKTAMAVAAGMGHTCALLNGGSIKCWGLNSYGQLGLGDVNARGDNGGEMGDNLPPIDLGASTIAVALAAGDVHTCALLDDGSVKCWGLNNYGQLGLADPKARGGNGADMGDNLPRVELGTGKAVALAAGGYHTCALLDDGSVKCWGFNEGGALGLGDMKSRGDEPNEMGNNLPPVDLGTAKRALLITAGYSHTCALLDDRSVKCWGWNESGQLGLADVNTRGDQAGEMGDNLPAVKLFSDVW